MLNFPLLLLPIVMGFFNVTLHWSDDSRASIRVDAVQRDEFMTQCLQGGLEVRFRFVARLCRHRSGWFDVCGSERIETHTVRYDPISQNYSVVMDTLRDEHDPTTNTVDSSAVALSQTSTVHELPVAELPPLPTHNASARAYASVRVFSECKEKSSNLLARIPSMISFGLLDFSTTDSGWINFDVSAGTEGGR